MKSETCFSTVTGNALTEYDTVLDAEMAADYISRTYANELSPYQCKKCGKWHLSLKSRQTPSRTCEYCTDGNGSNKELYETESGAENRAKILLDEVGIRLKVYKCPLQEGWHLTKG